MLGSIISASIKNQNGLNGGRRSSRVGEEEKENKGTATHVRSKKSVTARQTKLFQLIVGKLLYSLFLRNHDGLRIGR